MRILVAMMMMKRETNIFSPVPTDWQPFKAWGI